MSDPIETQGSELPVEGSEGNTSELIAGKFQSQDELIAAYKELETKLGSNKPAEEDGGADEETGGDKPEEQKPSDTERTEEDRVYEVEAYGELVASLFEKAGVRAKTLAEEFERDGKLSEERYEQLITAGASRSQIDAHLNEARGGQEAADQQVQVDASEVFKVAGGEAEYRKVQQWAAQNLSKEEVAEYNAITETGNVSAIKWAAQNLVSRMRAAEGYEPTLDNGDTTAPVFEDFSDMAAVQAAVKDPRYGKDVEYTNSVRQRIRKSNVISVR
jgi:hypothetical protein